jgi:lipopolysaccharide export system protein LptC
MAADQSPGPAVEGNRAGAPRPRFRLEQNRIGVKYSRFVGLMKLLLPAAAGVLVLMIIIWPQFSKEREGFRLGPSKISIETAGGQKLVNARYTGTDRRDNPFTITAKTLAQRHVDDEAVELRGPTADIFLDAGAWIAVSAPKGSYRKEPRILELTGGVDLFHDDGYEFHTEKATVDLAAGVATSDTPVHGHGPFGELQSSGFRISDGGERVQFEGKTRMLLNPAAADGS